MLMLIALLLVHTIVSIKTFQKNLYRHKENENHDNVIGQLDKCTLFHPMVESVFILGFCSQLSKISTN